MVAVKATRNASLRVWHVSENHAHLLSIAKVTTTWLILQTLHRKVKATNNKKLSFILLIILGTSTEACRGNILYENYTCYEGNRYVIKGIPLGCSGTGQYVTLCNDGTIEPSSAGYVCTLFGLPGQFQDKSINSISNAFTVHCCFFLQTIDGGKYDYSHRTIFEEIVWYNNVSCLPEAKSNPDLCQIDQVPTCESGPVGLTCYIPGMCSYNSKHR